MPPKPKVTKQEIIDAAMDVLRNDGPEAITARNVAQYLGTSTRPIFTYYSSMNELKDDLLESAKQVFFEEMGDLKELKGTGHVFSAFGMRWVRFAINNTHIYRYVFLTRRGIELSTVFQKDFSELYELLIDDIENWFGLPRDDSEKLFEGMKVLATGFATYALSGSEMFSNDDELSQRYMRACVGFVLQQKMRSGTFVYEEALELVRAAEEERIEEIRLSKTEA